MQCYILSVPPEIKYPYEACKNCPIAQINNTSFNKLLLKCSIENQTNAFVYGLKLTSFNKIIYREFVELNEGTPPEFCPQLEDK